MTTAEETLPSSKRCWRCGEEPVKLIPDPFGSPHDRWFMGICATCRLRRVQILQNRRVS